MWFFWLLSLISHIVMVRFGSVWFRGYFAQTLNLTISSVPGFSQTLNWTLGSGSKGSGLGRGGAKHRTECRTLFLVVPDYVINKFAPNFWVRYHQSKPLVVCIEKKLITMSSYEQDQLLCWTICNLSCHVAIKGIHKGTLPARTGLRSNDLPNTVHDLSNTTVLCEWITTVVFIDQVSQWQAGPLDTPGVWGHTRDWTWKPHVDGAMGQKVKGPR
jgi:hypothetical protein